MPQRQSHQTYLCLGLIIFLRDSKLLVSPEGKSQDAAQEGRMPVVDYLSTVI